MILLSELNGIKPTRRLFRADDSYPIADGVVGIEIEMENMPMYRVQGNEFWDVVSDGSLRNNGLEFVSKPLFGEDIGVALGLFNEEVEKNSPVISSRCGLHVHLDVTAFTTDDLLSLCVAVALVEDALYKYVGIERKDNIYCLPMANTDNILPYLNSIKYGRDRSAIRDAIKKTHKYSGFNILPILNQGSVEFRYHAGTLSVDVITKWIKILQHIVLISTRYTAQDLVAMSREAVNARVLWHGAPEVALDEEGYMSGMLTAKDVLNFTKLEDVWKSITDVYVDDSNFSWD